MGGNSRRPREGIGGGRYWIPPPPQLKVAQFSALKTRNRSTNMWSQCTKVVPWYRAILLFKYSKLLSTNWVLPILIFSTHRLTPFNGTAVEPEDFPLINYLVDLGPGQPRIVYHRVNITNDMLEEYSEHFFLSLGQTDAKVVIIEPRITNITIGESDGK